MPRIPIRSIAFLSLILLTGCASGPPVHRVWVAPRVDLKPFEMIGMVEFTSSSKGKLAALTTRRFAEAARRDQEMVRMIDVGSKQAALASVGMDRWDPQSCRAVGRMNGVRSMLVCAPTLSGIRPSVQLSALLHSGQVTAQVDATLEVEMIEAETGASIWSRSASATRTLGQVSVFGSKDFVFDADDPERAYGELVDFLVNRVAADLQGSWQTQ